MRGVIALAALLITVASPRAGAGPTDIARVDEYIDAPRALFGRTRPELERRLGPPAGEHARADGVALTWPGLDVLLSRSARVARVTVRAPGHPLPHALDIGAPRARVETVLGDAPEMTDELAVYRDADGFPNSVEFSFRAGRVVRIEWRFWTE